ncbi:MAG: hypothetical protein AAGG48_22165 [Planctomycetota bacterium]
MPNPGHDLAAASQPLAAPPVEAPPVVPASMRVTAKVTEHSISMSIRRLPRRPAPRSSLIVRTSLSACACLLAGVAIVQSTRLFKQTSTDAGSRLQSAAQSIRPAVATQQADRAWPSAEASIQAVEKQVDGNKGNDSPCICSP